MALHYATFENNLTSDPNDYMAVVQAEDSKTRENIIDEMISRGSTVTKAEAFSVMEEYGRAIEILLQQGYSINTPEFQITPSVSGVFTSVDDSFDKSRHAVKFNVKLGSRFTGLAKEVQVQKVTTALPQPVLVSFKDITSGTSNQTLTPGGTAVLKGSMLKWSSERRGNEGVYFVKEDGTETKVETMVKNLPGEQIFTIPALTPGNYDVVVRAFPKQNRNIREGKLAVSLQVL